MAGWCIYRLAVFVKHQSTVLKLNDLSSRYRPKFYKDNRFSILLRQKILILKY